MSGPAVMFEILAANQAKLAAFYSQVFGWKLQYDKEGYGYVHFPAAPRALMGGLGQAQPGVTGWGKGITFYLEVANLEATLATVVASGGKVAVKPVSIDGYHFAMFEDPEQNLIGIILPFSDTT